MKLIKLFIVLILCNQAMGQYYYNDILNSKQSVIQYQQLQTLHIKKITATSYEIDHSPTPGFNLSQALEGSNLVTRSTDLSGKQIETKSLFDQGRLISTQSFSNGIENKMEYIYNDRSAIIALVLTTKDTAMNYLSVEKREWFTNASGSYSNLIKIKNNSDSSFGKLIYDEEGNPVEEHWQKKNKEFETYYYYYNKSHQLTDIVRYNARLKKLMPDYQFEYDDKNRLIQLSQLSANGKYLTWKYTYNEKGLKISETCTDQRKMVIGSIEYRYE